MRAGAVAPLLALAVNALPQAEEAEPNNPETTLFVFPTPLILPISEPFLASPSIDPDLSTTTCCDTTIVTLSTTTIINSITSTYSGTVEVIPCTTIIYGESTSVITGSPTGRMHPSAYLARAGLGFSQLSIADSCQQHPMDPRSCRALHPRHLLGLRTAVAKSRTTRRSTPPNTTRSARLVFDLPLTPSLISTPTHRTPLLRTTSRRASPSPLRLAMSVTMMSLLL